MSSIRPTENSSVAVGGEGGAAVPPSGGPTASRQRSLSDSIGPFFQRYGVLIAFAAVILFFSLERSAFSTLVNMRAVFSGAAALSVLAAVLTVPMMMGDFDLSVGYNTQVLGAVVVTLMAFRGWDAGSSIIVTIIIGAIIGTLLGALIAWSKVSAFVITLGAGILLQGVELRITQGHTIFQGLSQSYVNLAQEKFLTFTLPVWIALVV